MDQLISIVFDGLAYAMILFIVSVGLSVTMGLMGFVNLAHGAFAMAGGYVMVPLMNDLGVPFPAALALAFVAVGLFSVVMERGLYRWFYKESELFQVLMTIGLVFMAIALATLIFGPAPLPVTLPGYLKGQVDLGFRSFPTYRVFMICAGAVLIAVLWLAFEKSRIGAQIRAAVDNRRMAQSIGIDVDRLFTITFAFGSGLAALGGGLSVEIVGLSPRYAIEYLVFFLIVVAVGGLGSVRGAFFAALILGILDNAGKYLYPEIGSFLIYLATFLVLLWRPHGLFGKA